jgi:excisionase family DNA binding protein
MKSHNEPLLLTPRDAAELLGVGRAAVYALITRGAIPTITVGRRKRIPRGHVDNWIAAQSTPAIIARPIVDSAVKPQEHRARAGQSPKRNRTTSE